MNERVLRIVQYLWEAQPHGLPFLADAPDTVGVPVMPDVAGMDEESARVAERRYAEELRLAAHAQRNLNSQVAATSAPGAPPAGTPPPRATPRWDPTLAPPPAAAGPPTLPPAAALHTRSGSPTS